MNIKWHVYADRMNHLSIPETFMLFLKKIRYYTVSILRNVMFIYFLEYELVCSTTENCDFPWNFETFQKKKSDLLQGITEKLTWVFCIFCLSPLCLSSRQWQIKWKTYRRTNRQTDTVDWAETIYCECHFIGFKCL